MTSHTISYLWVFCLQAKVKASNSSSLLITGAAFSCSSQHCHLWHLVQSRACIPVCVEFYTGFLWVSKTWYRHHTHTESLLPKWIRHFFLYPTVKHFYSLISIILQWDSSSSSKLLPQNLKKHNYIECSREFWVQTLFQHDDAPEIHQDMVWRWGLDWKISSVLHRSQTQLYWRPLRWTGASSSGVWSQ